MFFASIFLGILSFQLKHPLFGQEVFRPPASILVFDPWGIPLLKYTYFISFRSQLLQWHIINLILGQHVKVEESLLQNIKLCNRLFRITILMNILMHLLNISDGIYGSTFFNDNWFSWISVLLLVLFLFLFVFFTFIIFSIYNVIIMLDLKQQPGNWHFVDVVWLFVICYFILLGRYLN